MITSKYIAQKLGFSLTAADAAQVSPPLELTDPNTTPATPKDISPDAVSKLHQSLVEAIGEDFKDTETPKFKYPKHHPEAIPDINKPYTATDEDVNRVFRDLEPGEVARRPPLKEPKHTKKLPTHPSFEEQDTDVDLVNPFTNTVNLKRPVR